MSFGRRRSSALLSLLLCLLAVASCRSASEPSANETPSTDTVVSTTPPFPTREPDRYYATRTITIVNAGGENVVTKTSIAKDGPSRREESEVGTQRMVYLETPEGRFVILPERRVYAAVSSEDEAALDAEAEESSPDRLLHLEPINTSYQLIGPEVLGGRNTRKYRVTVNNSASGNVSQNETLIWIDETLSMPVKSETRSADGARTTMELSEIATDPGAALFQIPTGYEKIAFGELRKQLKGPQGNP